MPAILRRQLEFPYLDGQVFVSTLSASGRLGRGERRPGTRCPPPRSRSSIPSGIPTTRPVRVELPDVAAALGDGWIERYAQTLGELASSVLLADGGRIGRSAAADGWGGDRLVSLEGPDGAGRSCGRRPGTAARTPTSSAPPPTRRWPSWPALHAVLPGADVAGEQDAPVLVLRRQQRRHPAAGPGRRSASPRSILRRRWAAGLDRHAA